MKDKNILQNIPHSIKVLSQENDIMTLLVDNRKFFVKIYKANEKYYAIIMKNTKYSEICSVIVEDKILILFDSIVDFFINDFQLALSKSYEEYLLTKILADKLNKISTCNNVNQNSNNNTINIKHSVTDSNDKYEKQEEYKNQKYENHKYENYDEDGDNNDYTKSPDFTINNYLKTIMEKQKQRDGKEKVDYLIEKINKSFEKKLENCLTYDDSSCTKDYSSLNSLLKDSYSSHICGNCQFCFKLNNNWYCQGFVDDFPVETKPKFGCSYFIKKKGNLYD